MDGLLQKRGHLMEKMEKMARYGKSVLFLSNGAPFRYKRKKALGSGNSNQRKRLDLERGG